MFNFNPFAGTGNIPPFQGWKKNDPKATILSNDIEDVQFEDISRPPKQSAAGLSSGENTSSTPEYDEEARSRQISAAAMEYFREPLVKETHPQILLISIIWFSEAAKWYDKHPMAAYPSKKEWTKASADYIESQIERVEEKAGECPTAIKLMLTVAYFAGMAWAGDNPPKPTKPTSHE